MSLKRGGEGPCGHVAMQGIGHPMSPFELKIGDADRVLATLHSTLSLGLGYVSSTPGRVSRLQRNILAAVFGGVAPGRCSC